MTAVRPVGIDHAAISVRDLNRSVEFYTQVLGLTLTKREYLKPGIEYFLDCGSSLIGLIQGDPTQGEHLLTEGGIGANHVSLRVHTRDFNAAVENLKQHEVKIAFMKKRERSWSVYFYDPDGNKLEITAWPEEDRTS